MASEPIRIGGLMRCCIGTLHTHMQNSGPAVEGEKLKCQFHDSWMVFHNGAWEWDRLRDVMS